MTLFSVFRDLCQRPGEMLVRRWNWKSAIFSSLVRALLFFFANLAAGWRAAAGAFLAELMYRGITAGFYGALTQAFRRVEPAWTAGVTVMILLPLVSHSIEFAVHLLRGTPKLLHSMIVSCCFTVLSTLFNLYCMRKGVLVVGKDAGSVASDLRRMPVLIAGFVACGPLHLWRKLRSASAIGAGAADTSASAAS